MGLVDDDGEFAPAMVVADGVEDEGELLDGGDDDPLALLEQAAQMAGTFGMADDGSDLGELPDSILICLSNTRRSVTTITVSNSVLPSRSSPINWWASQAMELDLPLPAEC